MHIYPALALFFINVIIVQYKMKLVQFLRSYLIFYTNFPKHKVVL